MLWITKNRHNKIVTQYEEIITELRTELDRRKTLEKILDKLADKSNLFADASMSYVTGSSIMAHLDDTVPRYVEDVLGGKVIKQEATPVTILDEQGKASYGYTKEKADKGRTYKLIQK